MSSRVGSRTAIAFLTICAAIASACAAILDIDPGNADSSDASSGGDGIAREAGGSPCVLPWGGALESGRDVVAYGDGGRCSCTSEVRTCRDGVLSGSATEPGCAVKLIDSSKTYGACVDAGGAGAEIDEGRCLCRFAGADCPDAWAPHGDWRTTTTRECNSGCVCNDCSCTANGKTWSSHDPQRCGYDNYVLPSGCVRTSCTATTTEIGCR